MSNDEKIPIKTYHDGKDPNCIDRPHNLASKIELDLP